MSSNSNHPPLAVSTTQPVIGHEHIVFDADAADAFDVYARLDREYHPRLKHQVRLPGKRPPDSRVLMYFEPEPVPGAVPEGFFQSISAERRSSSAIDDARLDSRPDHGDGSLLSCSHGRKQTAKILTRIAKLNGSGKIHAVSVVDPAKVQHHSIALSEKTGAGTRVRQGTIGPRGHDRLERGALEPYLSEHGVEVTGDLELGPTGPGERDGLGCRTTEPAARFTKSRDLSIVFHDALALDQAFGWDEHGTAVGTPKRRRRRSR